MLPAISTCYSHPSFQWIGTLLLEQLWGWYSRFTLHTKIIISINQILLCILPCSAAGRVYRSSRHELHFLAATQMYLGYSKQYTSCPPGQERVLTVSVIHWVERQGTWIYTAGSSTLLIVIVVTRLSQDPEHHFSISSAIVVGSWQILKPVSYTHLRAHET